MDNKEELKQITTEAVTDMFEKILDYVQIAVPNKEAFSTIRSKILRVGNDTIRRLARQIEDTNENS